jgi:hypothetical protein
MRNIMDMISEKVKAENSLDTQSTTLIPSEPDSPLVIRIETAVDFMLRDILSNEGTSPKVKFMMKKILGEAMEELRDAPQDIIADGFMRQAALFYWMSTGQIIENVPMPLGFWDHVGQIPELNMQGPTPELESDTIKELEAGASVE